MPTKIHHRSYQARRQEYDKIRTCIEGEDSLKRHGPLYLPRPEGMTQKQYERYLTGTSFYAVAERTLRGLVGAATRNDPVVELPTRLQTMRETATFEGNSLSILIEDALREVLSMSRYCMVLDFPQETIDSLAIPHISTFDAEHILDYRTSVIDGKQVLTYLRLHEDHDELEHDDGTEQHLVLCLEPAYTVKRFTVTTRATGPGTTAVEEVMIHDPITPTVNGSPLFEIPAVIVSPYNLKADTEKPAFLDLVNLNLAHFRVSADYYWSLFLTSQPTPWVAGSIPENAKPTQIGSGAFWVLPEGSTAGMLEHSGAGIASMKSALEDLVDQMASLGARLLDSKGRNETEGTAKLRHKSEHSLLHSSVVMVEAATRKLLRLAAQWTSANPDDVTVSLHRDFTSTQIDPATLTALLKSWQAGAISHDTFLMNLKKGELMDVNRTLDDEKEMIGTDDNLMTVIPGG